MGEYNSFVSRSTVGSAELGNNFFGTRFANPPRRENVRLCEACRRSIAFGVWKAQGRSAPSATRLIANKLGFVSKALQKDGKTL